LELVTPIVEALDNLKTHMDYSEQWGSLIVGAYPDLVMHHLPRAVQAFRARFPDVRLRLLARNYLSLIQLVKSGEVDLAMCSSPPPDDSTLEFQEVFQNNVVLMTPPGHPLLERHPVRLQDIAAWPLILSGPESMTRQKVDQALKSHGINAEVVLAVDHTESIKRYVEIGMGVAICADFTLHPEDHDKLGVVRLDHIFTSSAIGVCTLKGKFLGQAVRNFINTLQEEMRGFHAEMWDISRYEAVRPSLVQVSGNDS
jgi:LysR family cys regulon transcriptional activator